MTATTTIALNDDRDTTFTVQTIPANTGTCTAGHGSCGKPGVTAVRNTIAQKHPEEVSTVRLTLCADHQGDAARTHAFWVGDARELQDPVKRAEFLSGIGGRPTTRSATKENDR